jgi:hypothetical protein
MGKSGGVGLVLVPVAKLERLTIAGTASLEEFFDTSAEARH